MPVRNVEEIDWKLTLLQILDCFGEMEGVWHDQLWAEFGVAGAVKEVVEQEYQKYLEEKRAGKKC